MGKLIDGKWTTQWYEPDDEGRFQREDTVFRGEVRRDGSSRHAPAPGRYHLYVSLACPWAHRTLIARQLLGLTDDIGVSVLHPHMTDDGWHFDASEPGATEDHLHGARFLRDVYLRADPHYTGRVTVPVLWDRELETIVNNESREVLRMLDRELVEPGSRPYELFPDDQLDAIESAIDAIYEPINNGVYSAGFAGSQKAYDAAVVRLFEALDHWEGVLERQRFMCGDRLTAADICLFTTLIRFDAVYFTHFKCNLRMLQHYPNLWGFTRDVYQTEGIAETVDFHHIKHHYFRSHPTLNPKGFVAYGPLIDYDAPHDRDRFERA